MNTTAITSLIERHYAPTEYPCLYALTQRWRREQPLRGKRILIATPLFRNTLTQYIALLAAGADITVGCSNVISYDTAMMRLVKKCGLAVIHPDDRREEFDIILDCAAQYAHYEAREGYVELTRSGVTAYAEGNKRVLMADSGRIKRIETILGTGESYFRAMAEAGHTHWAGKSLVVIGSGKVGSGIATYGVAYGAIVTLITEPETVSLSLGRLVKETIEYNDRTAVTATLAAADYIVTATGVAGAITALCQPEVIMNSKAVCANMGVEDEFGQAIPAERVLHNKQTLNFTLEEPTQLKYIDATLALHALGAVYLTQHPEEQGILLPPPLLEEELLLLTRTYGTISNELDQL